MYEELLQKKKNKKEATKKDEVPEKVTDLAKRISNVETMQEKTLEELRQINEKLDALKEMKSGSTGTSQEANVELTQDVKDTFVQLKARHPHVKEVLVNIKRWNQHKLSHPKFNRANAFSFLLFYSGLLRLFVFSKKVFKKNKQK